MDSYRANRQEKDQARVQQLRRDAEDLYVFLTSNRRHDVRTEAAPTMSYSQRFFFFVNQQELIKYYNEPIHDKDDMVERTARLVGLAMPKMPSESSFDEPLEGVVASVTGDASSAIPFSVPDLPTPAGM